MASLSEDELINSADADVLAELSPSSQAARAQSLFGKSIANMSLRGISMAARFLLIVGLAHYVAPSDVGIFTLMYASTTLGTLLLGARFDVYSTRAICANERTNAAVIIRDQLVFHLLVYAAILPLMLVIFVTGLLPWSLLGWFYVLLILEHVGQECNRLFVALGQPLRATFVFFVRSGLWAAAFIFMMYFAPSTRNLETLWLMWTAGGIACLLCSAWWMRSLGWRVALRERIDWSWIKRGLKPSAAYTVAVGAMLLTGTIDRYFLGATWRYDHVGVYGLYSNLTNFIPTFAETGIISLLLPTLLSSTATKNWAQYHKAISQMKRGVLIIVGTTSALSFAIVPVILLFVKKEPIYSEYIPAFAILVVAAILATLSTIPHNALYSNHKDRVIAKWSVFSMLLALVCFALLTPRFGIYGVSIGTLVSSAALLAGKCWETTRLRLPNSSDA